MVLTNSNPLRVATSKRVMNPIIDAIEIITLPQATEISPPTNAKGKLIIIITVAGIDLTAK